MFPADNILSAVFELDFRSSVTDEFVNSEKQCCSYKSSWGALDASPVLDVRSERSVTDCCVLF